MKPARLRSTLSAGREVGPLLLFAFVTLALLLFARLASEVSGGGSFDWDRELLLALRRPEDLAQPIGPGWLRRTITDLTTLGGTAVLTLVTAAAAGFLVAARKARAALFLVVAISAGTALARLLKTWLERPRPAVVPHLVDVPPLSFPSGHATNSAIVYLTIGLVLSRLLPGRPLRVYILLLAIALTALIGFSRVYLGVHYPSDVLAGWLLGSGWATLSWIVALQLQRRREIEQPQ